jgi:transcriptional regulator with XRE-family HTH domain/quercetin dioxygenase-like cupin family protein
VGERLRERRLALNLSVRELARRLSLSPSLISQIERGKATPSVGTLYAVTSELGLSMGTLFAGAGADAGNGGPEGNFQSALAKIQVAGNGKDEAGSPIDPVVGPDERKRIQLGSGVIWERLTKAPDSNVDFLWVEYQPGGASCEANALVRHAGREYGHVLSGTLEVTLGFETYILGPGYSISFDSTIPHRLATVGDEAVHALWIVVGRLGDSRSQTS